MKNSKNIMLSVVAAITMYGSINSAPSTTSKTFISGSIETSPRTIMNAIKQGDTAALSKMYQSYPAAFTTPNLGRWKLTPLMYAIFHGHCKKYPTLAATLLAMPTVSTSLNNVKDIHGRTTVYMAIDAKDFPSLKLLVEHRANLNVTDNKGETPLKVATDNKCPEDMIAYIKAQ